MTLPRFVYLAPKTIEETLALMAGHGEGLEVVAGGTEIMGHLKHRMINPSYVLSLRNVPGLSGIKTEGTEIVIGSMTTLREVGRSPAIAKPWKALCQAADAVAAPPIQNIGTIGGNLLQNTRCLQFNQSEIVRKASGACIKTGGRTCLAVKGGDRCRSVYQGDMAPALIACGARVRFEKTGSSRFVMLEEIFSGSGQSPFTKDKDELLTEIRVPVPLGRFASSYKKLRLRSSLDYPLASAAVFLSLSNGGIDDARLVIGACGPSPVLVTAATDLLKGKGPKYINAKEVAETVSKVGEPINNLILPGAYRRKMFKILAARAINEALSDFTEAGS
jgi:4-hydroxybenzoyl-CoA reductase subunit beta